MLPTKRCSKRFTYIDDRRRERDAEKRRISEQGGRWDPRSQYRIQPPSTPPTADYPLWQFSCVGLVLAAYRRARIVLVTGPYPLKTVDDLKRLYPYAASDLDDPDRRKALGLESGDRWPVVLVGYVLHSLKREAEGINGPDSKPYRPREGDEFFDA